jgi:nitrite reductase/ring-hydroxylating ferredoxin subunit
MNAGRAKNAHGSRRDIDDLLRGQRPNPFRPDGSWQPVAASSEVPDDVMHPVENGSLIGSVRRVAGRPEAVSGICTHHGWRQWFDAPTYQLRCACHSTSFSPTRRLLAHQLHNAPKSLPQLQVREVNGAIEVLARAEPAKPACPACPR